MRLRVIAPTDSEIFEEYIGAMFPEAYRTEQVMFSWGNPESMFYPVLVVPEEYEWPGGYGKNDAVMSHRISLNLTRELKRRHEVNDSEFARIYLGASLIMRVSGIENIFAPRSADEMMTLFNALDDSTCRFCLSYAIENPYGTEGTSTVIYFRDHEGRARIRNVPDEEDETFLFCYPDDPIGVFIRFVELDEELQRQSDEFATAFVESLVEALSPTLSFGFN